MSIKPGVESNIKRGKKLSEEEIANRLVRQPEFIDHLNKVLFEPALGVELSRDTAKTILDGIAFQITTICLAGASVRLGDLGTFSCTVSEGANIRLPDADEQSEPMRSARLSFRSSVSTRRTVKDAKLQHREDRQLA